MVLLLSFITLFIAMVQHIGYYDYGAGCVDAIYGYLLQEIWTIVWKTFNILKKMQIDILICS